MTRIHPPHRARTTRMLRVLALAMAASAGSACAPRQVEVRTAVDRGADVSLTLDNDTARPVNVYAVVGTTEYFLRQVGARSKEVLPLRGVTAGSTVTLRAVSIDGRERYERKGVVAEGALRWQLP